MDINLKEKLATLCENSYTKNNYIQFSNDYGVQVYFNSDRKLKHLYVIFRGTDELIDWVFNLSFFPKKLFKEGDGDICAHGGYDSMLKRNRLLFNLLDKVEMIKNTLNYEIYVSGHSLGGCLSQLFSFYLQKEKNIRSNIVMFGSPSNIGNKEFQDFLKRKNIYCINYTFVADPVPKLLHYIYPNFYTKVIFLPNTGNRSFFDSHNIRYYRSTIQRLL